MFERYNEAARRVLFFARYEASQLGSRYIESEHILLGLLREGHGNATTADRILALSGLSPQQILEQIESRTVIQPKVTTSVEIPFSDPMKHVLTYAAEEADQLLHADIAPEHLLLGLLREDQSMAAAVLTVGRLTLSTARQEATRA